MTAPNGRLDKETHARVFAEEVVPGSRLHRTTAQEAPRAIITAGQPGAGKSRLVEAAEAEFSKNTVVVDPDRLRGLHPDIRELRQAHPYAWSMQTNHDAGKWAARLRDVAMEGRRNLIVDTTLSDADAAIRNIRKLQARGYDAEVRVVAAHRLESRLGIDQRFTNDLRNLGYARHVPDDFHTKAYSALPDNLDKVLDRTGARIRIFDREGRELYDSRASSLRPGEALERLREERMKDPKITRNTARQWKEQQDFHKNLPELLERSARLDTPTLRNLPRDHRAMQIGIALHYGTIESKSIDRTVRLPGIVRRSAGGAALAHDLLTTGQESARLLAQDNHPGAQSQVLRFGGRNLGMAGGAMAGARLGAMAGIEAGPGTVLGGLAGGIVGAVAGDALMDALDRARIHHQRDATGNAWHFDPQRGWERPLRTDEGPPSLWRQTLRADPALSNRLDYQASGTAVALAMAAAPRPRNPYRQDIERGDVPAGKTATEWVRSGADRRWQRLVYGPNLSVGGCIEHAGPEKAARLERAAQAVIEANAASTPRAMAQRYRAAYEQNGWERHGPMHEAVRSALETPRLPASDGREYSLGRDGQWRTRAWHGGAMEAQGNVRDELDGMHRRLQPVVPSRGERVGQASPDPQVGPGDAFAERLRRMLAAADAGDWASFSQDTQALAARPAAQALRERAEATADRQEQARQHTLLAQQAQGFAMTAPSSPVMRH